MVKFGKNKFKALKKGIAKSQKAVAAGNVSNKMLKKKLNADKKVTFQKQVLIKEAVSQGSDVTNLIKKVTAKDIIKKKSAEKSEIKTETEKRSKQKPVEKRKKRRKTETNDTRLLLSLMKKTNKS